MCMEPARSPVFFKLFLTNQNSSHMFPTALQNTVGYKLALLPSSKYIKTLIYNHLGIQMKELRPLKMSLQSAMSNRKLWEVPQTL